MWDEYVWDGPVTLRLKKPLQCSLRFVKRSWDVNFLETAREFIQLNKWNFLHDLLELEMNRVVAKHPSDDRVVEWIQENAHWDPRGKTLPEPAFRLGGSEYYEFDLYVAILLGLTHILRVMAGWNIMPVEVFWDTVVKAADDISCEFVSCHVRQMRQNEMEMHRRN